MIESLGAADVPARGAAFAILDVRDLGAFSAGHLPGSGHVPRPELAVRRSELPPRTEPVLVVAASGPEAREVAGELEALGYSRIAWLGCGVAELPQAALTRGPAARLWRPSPFLEQVLPMLPDPREGHRRALDLAAGAGREAAFLAMHGYQVEAWDHDAGALRGAQALAERWGCSIATQVRNLERRDPEIPAGGYDVLTVFRFLHRPLLRFLPGALEPGGCLVYETYLRGQERFGRPKHPRFLLDPGELPRAFPSLRVERYEESTPPEGPFVARLLARRPA